MWTNLEALLGDQIFLLMDDMCQNENTRHELEGGEQGFCVPDQTWCHLTVCTV